MTATVAALLPVLVLVTLVIVTAYWAFHSLEDRDIWSIAVYRGDHPTRLQPVVPGLPTLSGRDVRDFAASFVGDPFLLRTDGAWWMFFEFWNSSAGRGEIACASSHDGLAWTYVRRVLAEPFHLSYPCVIEADGAQYMIPETGEAGAVRLYRATRFPHEWTFVKELLQGRYLDASPFRFNDHWWMFAALDGRLRLHHADALAGPWLEHPASPLPVSPDRVRPGGRVVLTGGRLLRFAQDSSGTYGRRLFACEIVTLTETQYAEATLADAPVIGATGKGWNGDGMHHADPQPLADGSWLAAVDGKRIVRHFNGRRGARFLLNRLGLGRNRRRAASL